MCAVVVEKVRCEGEVAGSKPTRHNVHKTVVIRDFGGMGRWLTGGVLHELIFFSYF